jgi:hypothetical protein
LHRRLHPTLHLMPVDSSSAKGFSPKTFCLSEQSNYDLSDHTMLGDQFIRRWRLSFIWSSFQFYIAPIRSFWILMRTSPRWIRMSHGLHQVTSRLQLGLHVQFGFSRPPWTESATSKRDILWCVGKLTTKSFFWLWS